MHTPGGHAREDLPDSAEWDAAVTDTLDLVSTNSVGKVVLARKSVFGFAAELDPLACLQALLPAAERCYRFCFVPATGRGFLGVPPERLYRREGRRILCDAIAGTRTRGDGASLDRQLERDLMGSDKERREQDYVVRGIRESLAPLCGSLNAGADPSVVKLHQCQHLMSSFEGVLRDGVGDAELLKALHPTPAVGGYPTDRALREIEKREPFDRGWYAGPVGWVGRDSAEFAVAIRSGLVDGSTLSVFSGAGIVAGSASRDEWDELDYKISHFTQAPEPSAMTHAPNLNQLWAALLVEEFVRNGVDTFCVAPGSRSTPLVVAAARNDRARSIVHYDERGAAFHALGYGRVTGTPAAVITTSGSALANVWPAVVEASLEHIPLLVLSGDRPPELQDAGANQTMDQVKFFGAYAEWSANLPCPSLDMDPAVVLTTVDQAVSRCGGRPGAVHINCMFREPLAPTEQGDGFETYLEPVRSWRDGDGAYTRYEIAPLAPEPGLLAEVADLAARRPRGLLVAGRLADAEARAAVADLADVLGWPLLPDVTSGLRLDSRPGTAVFYQDVVLGSPEFMQRHPIEAVIHVGGRWTSRRLPDHLEASPPKDYVVVDEHPDRQDPIHRATRRFQLPVAEFCRALKGVVGNSRGAGDGAKAPVAGEAGWAPDAGWLASWQRASEHVGGRFDELFSRDRALSEPNVAWLVSRHIGAGEGLYLASSMPVRDVDTFGCAGPEPPVVAANRGASGVDGTIATATGFARGLGKCATLMIGDQAFLHDLNSLRLCRTLDTPFVIVVLNNDGGGIFSFLPVARFADVFERYFGAPHGMTFEHAAALFGLEYAQPSSVDEFVGVYEQARHRSGATVIEVRTGRRDNYDLHLSLRKTALEGL